MCSCFFFWFVFIDLIVSFFSSESNLRLSPGDSRLQNLSEICPKCLFFCSDRNTFSFILFQLAQSELFMLFQLWYQKKLLVFQLHEKIKGLDRITLGAELFLKLVFIPIPSWSFTFLLQIFNLSQKKVWSTFLRLLLSQPGPRWSKEDGQMDGSINLMVQAGDFKIKVWGRFWIE